MVSSLLGIATLFFTRTRLMVLNTILSTSGKYVHAIIYKMPACLSLFIFYLGVRALRAAKMRKQLLPSMQLS